MLVGFSSSRNRNGFTVSKVFEANFLNSIIVESLRKSLRDKLRGRGDEAQAWRVG